jgi:hypothetical protein
MTGRPLTAAAAIAAVALGVAAAALGLFGSLDFELVPLVPPRDFSDAPRRFDVTPSGPDLR